MQVLPEGRVEVIAEAGVNHNGDPGLALALVDAAAETGADVVKFQIFRADQIASDAAPKAAYQKRQTGGDETQHAMLKRLELTVEDFGRLIAHCAECGIAFLSTAGDIPSLQSLTGQLGQARVKLGSGELTNGPLLLASARSGARLILSTGMGTLAEVEDALAVLAFGMIETRAPGSLDDCRAALLSPEGWDALHARVSLLHCTTEYPAPVGETNLRAMDTLRAAFGLPVGYSDHTEGAAVSLAAVARGATIIEKHFTLDRAMPGPDHAASMEPGEFRDLVTGIRQVGAALGTGIKQPGPAELANRPVARKTLLAARDLRPGDVLRAEDILVRRAGPGESPMRIWDVIGTPLARGVSRGEILAAREQGETA